MFKLFKFPQSYQTENDLFYLKNHFDFYNLNWINHLITDMLMWFQLDSSYKKVWFYMKKIDLNKKSDFC